MSSRSIFLACLACLFIEPELITVSVSVVDYFYVSSIIAYLSQKIKVNNEEESYMNVTECLSPLLL